MNTEEYKYLKDAVAEIANLREMHKQIASRFSSQTALSVTQSYTQGKYEAYDLAIRKFEDAIHRIEDLNGRV